PSRWHADCSTWSSFGWVTGVMRQAGWAKLGLTMLLGVVQVRVASANDLLQLYHLAQTHDATLLAAMAQRDATIEAKPQALALLLPQISANASAERLKIGEQLLSPQTTAGTTITGCQIAAGAANEVCFGDGHGYGLSLSQTLWSFQSFSQLRAA